MYILNLTCYLCRVVANDEQCVKKNMFRFEAMTREKRTIFVYYCSFLSTVNNPFTRKKLLLYVCLRCYSLKFTAITDWRVYTTTSWRNRIDVITQIKWRPRSHKRIVSSINIQIYWTKLVKFQRGLVQKKSIVFRILRTTSDPIPKETHLTQWCI